MAAWTISIARCHSDPRPACQRGRCARFRRYQRTPDRQGTRLAAAQASSAATGPLCPAGSGYRFAHRPMRPARSNQSAPALWHHIALADLVERQLNQPTAASRCLDTDHRHRHAQVLLLDQSVSTPGSPWLRARCLPNRITPLDGNRIFARRSQVWIAATGGGGWNTGDGRCRRAWLTVGCGITGLNDGSPMNVMSTDSGSPTGAMIGTVTRLVPLRIVLGRLSSPASCSARLLTPQVPSGPWPARVGNRPQLYPAIVHRDRFQRCSR